MSEPIASFPWTSEPPTVEGLYLYRSPASAQTVVRVRAREKGGIVLPESWDVEFLDDGETEQDYAPGVGDEWAGPLTAPV